jgi:hypothetical protein
MSRRRNSAFYTWYPPHECYPAAWSQCDDPPKTYRIKGHVVGVARGGCAVLEVTEFEGFNGLWHVPHNEVYRIEKR